MRIGVDATSWDLPRGYGRHARCLLRALVELEPGRHRYRFFLADEPREALPDGVEARVLGIASPARGAGLGPRDLWRLARGFGEPGLDLVFFPNPFRYVPFWSRARRVVMFHDVTADLYPLQTLGGWKSRWLWQLKMGLARRQAHRILTVSEHSRQGLCRRFGVAGKGVDVILEAADPIFQPVPGVRPLPRRTLVHVGGFAAFKNLSRLVRVFARLDDPDVDLLLVGEYDREAFHSAAGELRAEVAGLGLEGRVHFPGFVSDPDLVTLLNQAVALVLPSYNEGFGLPALEAAACGCPVVATRCSPIPELLGEGALPIDPERDDELQWALERLLSDEEERRRRGQAALGAARRLSWDSAARKLLRVLEEVGCSS